jgi:hypothetical protein
VDVVFDGGSGSSVYRVKTFFVIVVLSGTNLKQVMLEPPSAINLETLPRRSKQH